MATELRRAAFPNLDPPVLQQLLHMLVEPVEKVFVDANDFANRVVQARKKPLPGPFP